MMPVTGLDRECASTYQRVYGKVQRRKEWRERLEQHRAAEAVISMSRTIPTTQSCTEGKAPSKSSTSSSAKSRKKRVSDRARAKVLDDALGSLPGWADPTATEEAMSKRGKRTPTETNRDNFFQNAEKKRRAAKYSMALKTASMELKKNQKTRNFEEN